MPRLIAAPSDFPQRCVDCEAGHHRARASVNAPTDDTGDRHAVRGGGAADRAEDREVCATARLRRRASRSSNFSHLPAGTMTPRSITSCCCVQICRRYHHRARRLDRGRWLCYQLQPLPRCRRCWVRRARATTCGKYASRQLPILRHGAAGWGYFAALPRYLCHRQAQTSPCAACPSLGASRQPARFQQLLRQSGRRQDDATCRVSAELPLLPVDARRPHGEMRSRQPRKKRNIVRCRTPGSRLIAAGRFEKCERGVADAGGHRVWDDDTDLRAHLLGDPTCAPAWSKAAPPGWAPRSVRLLRADGADDAAGIEAEHQLNRESSRLFWARG